MEIDQALLDEGSGETACDGEYLGKDGWLGMSVTAWRSHIDVRASTLPLIVEPSPCANLRCLSDGLYIAFILRVRTS